MPKAVKAETKVKTTKPEAALKTPKTSKLNVAVVDIAGAKKGEIALPKEMFGVKVNDSLMAQAVRVYLINQRQGTASTKTRGEVRGSTKKIYRQKGTGRARHGAITAPIFVGGGVALGPKPRAFEAKLSKQMKKKALFSALSSKLNDEKVFVIEANGATGKTKQIAELFKKLSFVKKGNVDKVLFLSNGSAAKASRNIGGVEVIPASLVNTYQVLKNNYVVIAKDSISELEKTFLGKGE